MITNARVVISKSFDPYFNLSLEEELLRNVTSDEIVLYLWRNENTVVIGRNQNPWKECNFEYLSEVKGKIARRLSGGGAVYHDLGNLNFTFLTHEKNEDLYKQLSVLIRSLQNLGIEAKFSGRNDILVDGKKISGNAFYWDNNKYYHHGTLMYDIDMEKLIKILTPPSHKLISKGIDSVRSRVTNLLDNKKDLTIEMIIEKLISTFETTYATIKDIKYVDENSVNLQNNIKKYSSHQWIYGDSPEFNISFSKAFDIGSIELNILLKDGQIDSCKIYTDSLYTKEFSIVENALKGCSFNKSTMIKVLDNSSFCTSSKMELVLNKVKEIIEENIQEML